jgi:hypothetical protein
VATTLAPSSTTAAPAQNTWALWLLVDDSTVSSLDESTDRCGEFWVEAFELLEESFELLDESPELFDELFEPSEFEPFELSPDGRAGPESVSDPAPTASASVSRHPAECW